MLQLCTTTDVWNTPLTEQGFASSTAGCCSAAVALRTAAALHAFLAAAVPEYRDKVCVARSDAGVVPFGAPAAAEPELPPGIVAVEWSPPDVATSPKPSSSSSSPPLSLLFLLGHSDVRADVFDAPMLSKAVVPDATALALHQRFAHLFLRLTTKHLITAGMEEGQQQQGGGDGSPFVAAFDDAMQRDWQAAVADAAQALLPAGATPRPAAPLECTAEIAGALAAVFNASSAVEMESEAVCCWLRAAVSVSPVEPLAQEGVADA